MAERHKYGANPGNRRNSLENPEIPAASGAYALILEFRRDIAVPVAGGVRLTAGRYLYAGSAYGPGGIRARVARHLRADKAVRWHIDHLRPQDHAIAVIALAGGNECALAAAAARIPGAEIPIPHFGASDCTNCAAHLIRVPNTATVDAIARSVASDDQLPIVIDMAGTISLRRSSRPKSG